jgi:hypothetical protein
MEQVVARVRETLGDPSGWPCPTGYPDALALCVIDAIQSMGVRYGSVIMVLGRYRALRRRQGADPAFDGTPELLATFADLGDPERWAAVVGNAHKTSTREGAPLKARAVKQAAEALLARGISTCDDLRRTGTEGIRQAKRAWRGVPGQSSGISWRYLLMLSGRPGVKPDRMIIRFVAAALGRTPRQVSIDLAADLVSEAARRIGVTPSRLDHAIWRRQSGRDS